MTEAEAEQRRAVVLPIATLAFGGVTIRWRGDEPAVRFRVRDPHTRFLVADESGADCEIGCRFGEPRPWPGRPLFDSGGIWELRRDGAREQVAFYTATPAGERVPLMTLELSPSMREGAIVHAPRPDASDCTLAVGFPLDEYVAARLLARRRGVVLHASSVVDDGGAYLFVGHSGAGKSTMAGIAERAGARVLSDDRTIVRLEGDAPIAWGTPWHGSYSKGSPERAPVRAIFLLLQDAEDRAEPIDAARAFKELLVRLVQPTIESAEMLAGVEVAERAASVPAAALHFRPTPAAFDVARRFAAGAGDVAELARPQVAP